MQRKSKSVLEPLARTDGAQSSAHEMADKKYKLNSLITRSVAALCMITALFFIIFSIGHLGVGVM